VFVGRVVGSRRCLRDSMMCSDVRVVRALGGAGSAGQTLPVFTPTYDLSSDSTLCVVRRNSEGVYEPLGWLAGSQPLQGNLPARWRMPLEEVERRYRLFHGDSTSAPRGE